jgi:hypothetical protein
VTLVIKKEKKKKEIKGSERAAAHEKEKGDGVVVLLGLGCIYMITYYYCLLT